MRGLLAPTSLAPVTQKIWSLSPPPCPKTSPPYRPLHNGPPLLHQILTLPHQSLSFSLLHKANIHQLQQPCNLAGDQGRPDARHCQGFHHSDRGDDACVWNSEQPGVCVCGGVCTYGCATDDGFFLGPNVAKGLTTEKFCEGREGPRGGRRGSNFDLMAAERHRKRGERDFLSVVRRFCWIGAGRGPWTSRDPRLAMRKCVGSCLQLLF